MNTITPVENLDKYEREVYDILINNLTKSCTDDSIIYPKYQLMERNDRDCEILLFIEPNKDKWVFKYNEIDNLAYNLVILIEVKSHTEFRGEQNNQIIVQYPTGPSDALEQVKLSRRKLGEHLKVHGLKNCWVYYFVAFPRIFKRTLSEYELQNYKSYHVYKNILLNEEIGLRNILEKCFFQRQASPTSGRAFSSYVASDKQYKLNASKFSKILSGINKPIVLGKWDRERFENLSKEKIKISGYLSDLDNGNLKIGGKAGTGKTIALLKLAIHYVQKQNKSVLFITFNTALAADIYRGLKYYFENYYKGLTDLLEKIKVINLDQLLRDMYELSRGWHGIHLAESDPYWLKYEKIQGAIENVINSFTPSECRNIFKIEPDLIILDEAQDLDSRGIALLTKLNSNRSRIVAADSPEQWLRNNRLDILDNPDLWIQRERNINYRNFKKIAKFGNKVRRHLKSNILKANSNIEIVDQEEVDVAVELPDGNIEIFKDEYLFSENRLRSAIQLTADNGYENWAVMILNSKSDDSLRQLIKYLASLPEKLEYWDGHDETIRKSHSAFPQKIRILDYESCRGLEGWIVILRNIDIVFDKTVERLISSEGFDRESAIQRVSNLFYIAITRTVSTLYITYSKDGSLPNILSEYAKGL